MRISPKTLFSNSSLNSAGEVETKKISYWLEKLFNQAKSKEKDAIVEQLKKQVELPLIATKQTSQEKGLADAATNHANKIEKSRLAVEDMVNNSNRILHKISSVFPWDLFPTSIIVEETRITIIDKQLFSSQIHSVDIKNISNIFIDTSILFAQLTIVSDTFAQNQIIIGRLWKKEAMFTRRLIEGLRMFVAKDIDTTVYSKEELINKLRELSTTKIVA